MDLNQAAEKARQTQQFPKPPSKNSSKDSSKKTSEITSNSSSKDPSNAVGESPDDELTGNQKARLQLEGAVTRRAKKEPKPLREIQAERRKKLAHQ